MAVFIAVIKKTFEIFLHVLSLAQDSFHCHRFLLNDANFDVAYCIQFKHMSGFQEKTMSGKNLLQEL